MDQDVRTIIKKEIGELAIIINSGFESLQGQVTELKTDMAVLKTSVNTLQATVSRIDTRTQNQMDAVYEDIGTLKRGEKETKEEIVSIKAHVGLAV